MHPCLSLLARETVSKNAGAGASFLKYPLTAPVYVPLTISIASILNINITEISEYGEILQICFNTASIRSYNVIMHPNLIIRIVPIILDIILRG